jgi:hypothetical protein
MGGNSSNTSQTNQATLRFAPYIEGKHSDAINTAALNREATINNSPYSDYSAPDIDTAFFGIGFSLSSYPSLFDAFGKNMAGLDIDALFSNNFSEKFESSLADNVLESELSILDDSIEQDQNNRILAREHNACNSSSFVIGIANIEKDRIKKTTDLRIELKYSLIPGVVDTWTATLNWNKSLVTVYAESLRDYFVCKQGIDEAKYRKITENTIWPLTVLDFERSIFSAMRGSRSSNTLTKKERSLLSKALLIASYTWTGAVVGSNFGPYGTIIGGIVGFVIGIAVVLLE